jgi:iron complex outermembrane receptor protein
VKKIALIAAISLVIAESAVLQRVKAADSVSLGATDQSAAPSAAPPAATGGLEELIVTAQRRSESLLRVPIAISALTSNDLQNQGITNAASLSSVVPNLQVNSGFGDAQPNFSLRGISVGNEYNTNQASPVGVYVDDEYLPFRSTHSMQLFDLERVEVVKGPQGTLFGRNTSGGLINFITKQPDLTGSYSGYADVGYGRFNEVRTQLAGEDTIVPGVFGVRAAVNYHLSDGYVKELTPGVADGNSIDTLAGRVIFRYKPTADLDMSLKVSYAKGDPTQAAVYQKGTGPNITNPITGYSRAGLGFWEIDSYGMRHNKTNQKGALLTLKYDFADRYAFTSLSSYGTASLSFGQDGAGTPYDLLNTLYHSDFKWLNQEFRVNYAGDRLKWQAGTYFGTDRNDTLNHYGFFFFAGPTVAQTIFQVFTQTRQSAAVFAQADLKITDNLTVTLGDRYTKDRSKYENGLAYIGDINFRPVVYTVGTPGSPLPTKGEAEGSDTYRAALDYTTDGGTLFYASLNHGYRAGTFSGQGYFSPAQIYLTKPETVNAYEVGAKGKFWDGRAEATAALFLYRYKDQQINNVVGAVGFLINAPKSTVKGFESDVRAELASNLTARFGIGVLYARYDELSLTKVNLAGNNLPFAPHVTVNTGFDWMVGRVVGGDVNLAPTLSYTSREFFSPFNTLAGNQNLQQGALTLLSANLAWTKDKFSTRLYATNLLNKESFTYGLNLQGSFGYDYLLQGPPREYGVELRYTF